MMAELTIDVRVAFQELVWSRYKITIPNFTMLLDAYLLRGVEPVPQKVSDLEDFLSEGFAAYLEPIPGFIASKTYSKRALEKAGIRLVEKGPGPSGWSRSYQDERSGTWWADVEGRFGELVGHEFHLLGKDNLDGLQISG